MRWGFGWELGPFEILDAIGTEPRVRDGLVPPAAPGLQLLRSARDRSAIVKSNPGAASSISATACCASSSTRR